MTWIPKSIARSEYSFVLSVIAIGIAVFAVLVVVVEQGNFRTVQIFLPEQIRQTVAFEENGKVRVQGVVGIGGADNPTLVTRSGDYAYILTVVNHGKSPHMFYIDGLDVQTKLLQPGDEDTLTLLPKKPGTYHYYDKADGLHLLGELDVVQVLPKDKLE
jgi:hypothetical protein